MLMLWSSDGPGANTVRGGSTSTARGQMTIEVELVPDIDLGEFGDCGGTCQH